MRFETCVIADFQCRHVENVCFATYPQLSFFVYGRYIRIAVFEFDFVHIVQF